MDNTKKLKWLKALEYSLPALITILIFTFAMIVKGIYPFGKQTIGYIDYNEQLVPFYTTLYDIFHGRVNSFVDFNLGAGGSIATVFVLNGYLSPISWLIALFKRSHIIYAITFLIMIRLALMATTAYACFKHFFKNTNKWVLLLFSLVWTFSGWTLVHFTNVGWLDLLILLPLLIMAAEPLVNKGKNLFFVLTLTYMLCLSYYISYMVLVGVVVIALYYVIFLAKEKKKVASHLFSGIIISILISFVAFIPSCMTSLQAHRFSSSSAETLSSMFVYFFSKVIVVFMFALPFVFFVRLMFKMKEDKKTVLFFLLTFITLTIGILIEPINKMWHTGSYACFPIRYGFIPIMFAIFGALYYINKYMPASSEEITTTPRAKMLNLVMSPVLGLCFIILAVAAAIAGTAFHPYLPVEFAPFCLTVAMFGVSYGLIELFLHLGSKKLRLGNLCGGILIFALTLVQIICSMTGYLGSNYSAPNTSRITNALELDLSRLDKGYKIKDRDFLYNSNFATLTNFPTLQTWIHISSEEQYQAYDKLGFNTENFILLSSGGTVLTDLILGNKYILSKENLDSRYFSKIDVFEYTESAYERAGKKYDVISEDEKTYNVYLYKLNFEDYKILTTNVDLNSIFEDESTYFERQNALYKALYNQVNDIFVKSDFTISEDEKNYYLSAENISEGFNCYLSVSDLLTSLTYEVNGEQKAIYKGINDLGIISGGKIDLTIPKKLNDDINLKKVIDSFELCTFDIGTFQSIHNAMNFDESEISFNGRSLEIRVDNFDGKKYAFIPFTYLNNMSATINNKDAKLTKTFESFMSIEMAKGVNEIKITYEPQYLLICGIISCVSLLIFIIFAFVNHRFNIASNKFVVWTGFIGACVILLAVGVLVYIKPFFTFFINLFKG